MEDIYFNRVKSFAESEPTLATQLALAHGHRLKWVRRFAEEDKYRKLFQGMEDILAYFRALGMAVQSDSSLRVLVPLFSRIIGDFETAFEAALSGYHGVTADRMRDVIEIEYLLYDFAADISRAELWLNADDRTLRREFGASKLREREAARRGISVQDLPGTEHYDAHSRFLHVRPLILPLGYGLNMRVDAPEDMLDRLMDFALCELFVHSRDILFAAITLIEHVDWESIEEQHRDKIAKYLDFKKTLSRWHSALYHSYALQHEMFPPIETHE